MIYLAMSFYIVIVAETLIEQNVWLKPFNPRINKTHKTLSLQHKLIECLVSESFDGTKFEKELFSVKTESQLQQHLSLVQQLRVSGFPALFYVNENNEVFALTVGFCEVGDLEERFDRCNEQF